MILTDKEQIDDQIRSLKRDSIMILDDYLEENFTVNIELDCSEWRRNYEKLTHEFEKSSEGLFVYPFERLHMTILGRINKETSTTKILESIRKNIIGKEIVFNIGYLACNEASVSVVSEPCFDLEAVRNNFRRELGIKGDDYTKYLPIYEKLAWVNFIRFKEIPDEDFFETLWKMRNYSFGEYRAREVSLFLNTSRTMDPARSKLVERMTI